MFSGWFQQAKELVSPPSVQMGQPISSEATASKKKKIDEEGEVTEEGFVCVGRSSFIYSSPVEEPAVPFSPQSYLNASGAYSPYPYPQSTSNSPFGGHPMMYPSLPSPCVNMDFQNMGDSSSLEPMQESLRNVPFVLHPDLRPRANAIYDPSRRVNSMKQTIDWSQFDYDFDFERSIIREVSQHYSNRNGDLIRLNE